MEDRLLNGDTGVNDRLGVFEAGYIKGADGNNARIIKATAHLFGALTSVMVGTGV